MDPAKNIKSATAPTNNYMDSIDQSLGQEKIAVLFGGSGSEAEVSCSTAKSILSALDERYLVKPVFITHIGLWVVGEKYYSQKESCRQTEGLKVQTGIPAEIALDAIEADAPKVVFIALHGEYGEDGTVQTLLSSRKLAFTGSDAIASALAFNKPRVLQLLQDEGVTTPEYLEVGTELPEEEAEEFVKYHGLPVFILPSANGSSVGVMKITKQEEFVPALIKARQEYSQVIISREVDGTEVSCGVLAVSKNEIVALPPTEIVPKKTHQFFDYQAKYEVGETNEITPARLPAETLEKIKQIALKVHHLVGADGYSRTDMIVDKDGEPHVLEINTLPGMTVTSILPREAKAYGMSFSELLTTIIENVVSVAN